MGMRAIPIFTFAVLLTAGMPVMAEVGVTATWDRETATVVARSVDIRQTREDLLSLTLSTAGVQAVSWCHSSSDPVIGQYLIS